MTKEKRPLVLATDWNSFTSSGSNATPRIVDAEEGFNT